MVTTKKHSGSEEQLNRLASEIVHASAAPDSATEEAATSPFLYTRLRSRIADESQRREEGERWYTILGVIWRTVPAMALVAIFACLLFLSTSSSTITTSNSNYDSLLGERDGAGEMVFADRQFASSDDVLSTILDDEEQGVSR